MDLKDRYKKETGNHYRNDYSRGDYGIHTDEYVEWVENKLKLCEGNRANPKNAKSAPKDIEKKEKAIRTDGPLVEKIKSLIGKTIEETIGNIVNSDNHKYDNPRLIIYAMKHFKGVYPVDIIPGQYFHTIWSYFENNKMGVSFVDDYQKIRVY